eukprot:CAMPEP_0196729446 /NCGR_PEP_ID=MMETSP1091-20130531/9834_1 /TAXON_ID=302021 /ORGANISM="Rhodomonas sp., Strain CCMP768" /LENGTH=323 /DNA_ID=CAMNT_0042072337 /DNA_START=17 /DNA_END=988 /DNA_ORIENTATION=+
MPKKKNTTAPEQPIVAADGAVWHGVDETKVYEKFVHYDKDGNGRLDAQEVVDLSVDLYHAFNPGKELTGAQIKDVHDKLLERIDERHGDHDGTISFDEFLPWYAQAAEKHWKMVHGMPHEPHDTSGGSIPTPLDTPLQAKPRAMLGAAAPTRLGAAPPNLGAGADQNFPDGFQASTTMFPTEAPEKLENGAMRASSVEQAVKVLSDNMAKVLIARRLDLQDAGTTKLAAALKKNTILEEIYLSQNNIGPAGAKELANAVAVHPTLKEVYMGYNKVSDAGATDLINAGAKSKTVKVMDVDCDGIKQTPKPVDGNIEAVCDFFNQ